MQEVYLPPRRIHRKPYNLEDEMTAGAPVRVSRRETEIHVMSYNVLADMAATPERGHDVQAPHILDF